MSSLSSSEIVAKDKEVPHRGPPMGAVPRRFQGCKIVQNVVHGPLVEGLTNHDRRPACSRSKHSPHFGWSNVLYAHALRLLNHVHHFIHVWKGKQQKKATRSVTMAKHNYPKGKRGSKGESLCLYHWRFDSQVIGSNLQADYDEIRCMDSISLRRHDGLRQSTQSMQSHNSFWR